MIEANGQQYQLATCKAVPVSTLAGAFPLKTMSKIEYKTAAPKKRTNNSEGKTDGYTIDKEEITASMTMKLSEWNAFRIWLINSSGGLGVLQATFDLPFSYGNRANAIKTDVLRGVMIQEEPRTAEDGQEVMMVDLPLFVMHVDYDGGNAVVYESDAAL